MNAPCCNICIFNDFFQKTSLSWGTPLSTKLLCVCTTCLYPFYVLLPWNIFNSIELFHFYGSHPLFAHLRSWNLHSAWLTWIRYVWVNQLLSEFLIKKLWPCICLLLWQSKVWWITVKRQSSRIDCYKVMVRERKYIHTFRAHSPFVADIRDLWSKK